MDPLSQGVLGAVLPQSFILDRKHLVYACIIGFLGGMSADLDILIRSSEDSLLYLEYHRQFTHSLIFIPFGGFFSAVIFHYLYFKKYLTFKYTYIYATLGYATHALLDACTSYGTQLFWPFTNYRVAWNNVSIIDPLFTLPLLILMILSLKKKSQFLARIALAYGVFYLLLGVFQRERAQSLADIIIEKSKDKVLRVTAKPSFGNLLVWKIIYETKDRYYTVGARMVWSYKIYPGDSIKKLNVEEDFPWLKNDSTQRKDIERFRWFSDGYLAKHPTLENVVVDVRYSTLPDSIDPLWGITLDPQNQNKHAKFEGFRDKIISRSGNFFKYILGED